MFLKKFWTTSFWHKNLILGTLGRKKDKLAKLQAEELKTTMAKNEFLEKELKELKQELQEIQLSRNENEMAKDVLNKGTINAQNEFRMDQKDLEMHMENRFNFTPTKVGENTENSPRGQQCKGRRRSRFMRLIRLLRIMWTKKEYR